MYKVGDKVQVKSELAGGRDYGNVYFASDMEMYTGKNFVITHVEVTEFFTCYDLDGAPGWDWSKEMFVGIEKTNDKKEQPVRKMSFEDIQNELGYKIEIVEHSYKGVE